jgi:hypothetical protein
MCDKIDNILVVQHGFWLIWLQLHMYVNDLIGLTFCVLIFATTIVGYSLFLSSHISTLDECNGN